MIPVYKVYLYYSNPFFVTYPFNASRCSTLRVSLNDVFSGRSETKIRKDKLINYRNLVHELNEFPLIPHLTAVLPVAFSVF